MLFINIYQASQINSFTTNSSEIMQDIHILQSEFSLFKLKEAGNTISDPKNIWDLMTIF